MEQYIPKENPPTPRIDRLLDREVIERMTKQFLENGGKIDKRACSDTGIV